MKSDDIGGPILIIASIGAGIGMAIEVGETVIKNIPKYKWTELLKLIMRWLISKYQ